MIRMREEPVRLESFAAEREWTVEGIPVLRAAVTLPQPAWEDATARRIRRFYQLQARSYLRYCQRWLLPQAEAAYREALAASAPLPCFTARLDYRVTCSDGRFLSLYTQSREAGLPGQTQLARHGDTWDLASGYPAPLSAFCPRGYRKRLLAAAEAEIRRQEAAGTAQYRPDWRRQLRRCFNPRNYYLTEEGLAFFYPMYAIAPAMEGIPVFTVPLREAEKAARS